MENRQTTNRNSIGYEEWMAELSISGTQKRGRLPYAYRGRYSWVAAISINGKHTHIGNFPTEKEASFS